MSLKGPGQVLKQWDTNGRRSPTDLFPRALPETLSFYVSPVVNSAISSAYPSRCSPSATMAFAHSIRFGRVTPACMRITHSSISRLLVDFSLTEVVTANRTSISAIFRSTTSDGMDQCALPRPSV
jgi:hypothetical protein